MRPATFAELLFTEQNNVKWRDTSYIELLLLLLLILLLRGARKERFC